MHRLILRATMLGVALVVTALAAGALLDALAPDASDQAHRAALQDLDIQRRALELERARLDAEREQAYKDTMLPWLIAAQVGALVLAGGLLLAGGGVLLHAYYMRRRPLVTIADGAAVLPRIYVEESTRPGLAALQGYHQAATIRAGVALPPHTYSPHYAPHFSNRQDGAALAAPDAPQLAPGPVPTFADLRGRGMIGPGLPLVLGWADGQPLTGDWRALYSTAISGLTGSGKTTAIRFLAAQAALHGARFVALDPHPGKEADSLSATVAPLAGAFLCAPATDDRAAVLTLQLVEQHLRARLRGQDRDRTPLIVLVDEFSHWMGRSTVGDPLARLLEAIAQEGRGVGVYATISGQIWSATRAGGTELRDSLASAYILRTHRRQARFLVASDALGDVETLPTGAAYLWRTTGDVTRIAVPNTTGADLEAVAARWEPGRPQAAAPPPASRPPVLLQPAAPATDTLPAPGDAPATATAAQAPGRAPSAEDQQIVALFLAGQDIPAIIKALWNVTSSSPRQYTPRYQQVQAVLRRALDTVDHE